mgnify:CR=1 FL=1
MTAATATPAVRGHFPSPSDVLAHLMADVLVSKKRPREELTGIAGATHGAVAGPRLSGLNAQSLTVLLQFLQRCGAARHPSDMAQTLGSSLVVSSTTATATATAFDTPCGVAAAWVFFVMHCLERSPGARGAEELFRVREGVSMVTVPPPPPPCFPLAHTLASVVFVQVATKALLAMVHTLPAAVSEFLGPRIPSLRKWLSHRDRAVRRTVAQVIG